MPRTFLLGVLFLLVLSSSGCTGMFFQPDRKFYLSPAQFGLLHEEVAFKSKDGTSLVGWFIPGKGNNRGKKRGTVIHFHGNAANISNHISYVYWLPQNGFNLFLFDYRGYGGSEGRSSRSGSVKDGIAAIEYVRARKDIDPTRLFIYGQSLGGALSVPALEKAGTTGVCALMVEGTFASYRHVVKSKINEMSALFSWFQYIVPYLFFTDFDSAGDAAKNIKNTPVLVIHGDKDPVVPFKNGKALFDIFPGSDKTFWQIKGGKHLNTIHQGISWQKKLVKYMTEKARPTYPKGCLPVPPHKPKKPPLSRKNMPFFLPRQ